MIRPPGLVAATLLLCGLPSSAAAAAEPGPTEPPPPASHANRLAKESSPYLLLHAGNPVDWYPWGEEALARARQEEKPIFLSVGYSTCYWCHVMEREVFSEPAIAELMNRWFVNIKVDREERPDLDDIYMTATQLLTRGGGWPNSVFLTPNLEPFYAGTYFPPEDAHGRPGFATVLRATHDAWMNQRPAVEAQAGQLATAMRQILAARAAPAATVPDAGAARAAVSQLTAAYDPAWGGFGPAPKFPGPGRLFLLWEAGERGSDEHNMVLETLRRMGRGGIYDQVAGGFHRYSTDERWLVPHFEKMLYDNAHLAELLAVAWREARDPELERLARRTLDFVLREMTLPEGAFKSAIDAQTDSDEGAYYVWAKEELRSVLGEQGFALLAPIYGFAGAANFEGQRYVLHLTAPLAEHAQRLGVSPDGLARQVEPYLDRLRQARERRQRPLVDDKVLTDWNGMMIAALARAGQILPEPRYVEAARRAAAFLLRHLDPEAGPLLHAWRGGQAKLPAFLDDYAFFIRGLLALDQATGEKRWLAEAVRLADELHERLAAPAGGYYLTAPLPGLLFQPLSVAGGAIPSGNSVAVHDLLTLAQRTGEPRFRERAERSLKAFGRELEEHPIAAPMLAAAVLRFRAANESAQPGRAAPNGVATATMATEDLRDLSREVVEARAVVSGAGSWRPLAVRLRLKPGWHINANPASEDFLIPTEVKGAVRSVAYPPGEASRFAFSPTPLAVYAGAVVLRGEVAANARSVLLTYQACDERRCLPPVTKTLELEKEGKPSG